LNRLADLNYAVRGHIVQEALEMEDENEWKHLEMSTCRLGTPKPDE
jgi:hypothetical protein